MIRISRMHARCHSHVRTQPLCLALNAVRLNCFNSQHWHRCFRRPQKASVSFTLVRWLNSLCCCYFSHCCVFFNLVVWIFNQFFDNRLNWLSKNQFLFNCLKFDFKWSIKLKLKKASSRSYLGLHSLQKTQLAPICISPGVVPGASEIDMF